MRASTRSGVAFIPPPGTRQAFQLHLIITSPLPDNPIVRYHAGLAALKVGDKEGARKSLTAAVNAPVTFTGKDEARKALAELQ